MRYTYANFWAFKAMREIKINMKLKNQRHNNIKETRKMSLNMLLQPILAPCFFLVRSE